MGESQLTPIRLRKQPMIDYARQFDLEDLDRLSKEAKTTSEKERYQKLAHKIINQSTTITSLRNEMTQAFRAGDFGKVKRIRLHIQAVRLEETRGASWGAEKQERTING